VPARSLRTGTVRLCAVADHHRCQWEFMGGRVEHRWIPSECRYSDRTRPALDRL